ncbi:hypothetical protein DEJ51_05740 [Streptomyces venezuelae]|uniref:Uncharacterized protein n=1 Tax=Streptomyces venezuelae TaxID=54571 RepID=A0A5P2DGC5_STRVZ|nr:hypothetical protein [Streptomyces venezuelae]QES53813.1 hypothetical protein DEJ51_05740 [Streptomyces venezuelae]
MGGHRDMAPYRRPLAIALTAGAAVLVAGALIAYRWGGSDGGLVILNEVHAHFVAMGWLALVSLIAAALLGARRPYTRVALTLPVAVLGIPIMTIFTMLSLLAGGQERSESLEAPGREDRRLVVEEGSAMIDPLWFVYVHQGEGLWERRWAVGYFNGDAEDNELREAVWTAPDRIRLTTSGGVVEEVTITADGRPDRTVSAG